MKRPSFQFYPGDWQRNANLRRCSPAARGVWMDIMCLMHDSDEYGVLRWPLKEIAQAAGAAISNVRELVDKAVLKGIDKGTCEPFVYTPRSGRKDGEPVPLVPAQPGPIWYSSRMVKDEYVRTIRGESSRFGGESGEAPKRPPKHSPKPTFGDGSSSASATAVLGKVEVLGSEQSAPAPDVEGFVPTPSGQVGQALKRAGISLASVSLPDPRISALLEQGATPDEFEAVAREAVERQIAKPVGWICSTLAGRRADAAKLTLAPAQPKAADPMAWRKTTDGVLAMGQELGVQSREADTWEAYERRVLSAFQRREAAKETS